MSDAREMHIPDVDYYDCGGRHETQESHPSDPTRFIKCDNGRAQDMSCPPCTSCKGGYMIFDATLQICQHNH